MSILHLEILELEHIATVLKALGHPIRIKIMAHLVQGPLSVGNIAGALDLKQAIISQHLRTLRQARLVQVIKSGNMRIYKNANPNMKTLLNCIASCKKGDPQ